MTPREHAPVSKEKEKEARKAEDKASWRKKRAKPPEKGRGGAEAWPSVGMVRRNEKSTEEGLQRKDRSGENLRKIGGPLIRLMFSETEASAPQSGLNP